MYFGPDLRNSCCPPARFIRAGRYRLNVPQFEAPASCDFLTEDDVVTVVFEDNGDFLCVDNV